MESRKIKVRSARNHRALTRPAAFGGVRELATLVGKDSGEEKDQTHFGPETAARVWVCFLFYRVSAIALATVLAVPSGCSRPNSASGGERPEEVLTFTRDVAPILFEHCSDCHNPHGSAPFSLLTYLEVRKRAQQIVDVTESRFMPPWLPEPGDPVFEGERRLSEAEIQRLAGWVEQGATEGSPGDLPSVPEFTSDWKLGAPDLVLQTPEAYLLSEEGRDVFRNLVFPIPVKERRFVRAVAIHPGNKRVFHHANILIDRSGYSRALDAADREVGFGGMELEIESERFEPQSHFLFWKPGSVPSPGRPGMSWEVDRDTDLILNMHMQPSGKAERIQPRVAVYFSDVPPVKHPMLLQLENDAAIDIAPGVRDFEVREDFVLPLQVDVLGIYPHAHYLGKTIEAFATLPDGSRKRLISIKEWDFNWQAVYSYVEPIRLPKGTTVTMRFTYDNSSENTQNPNSPPKRVQAGNQSTEEMAHLWIQVLPSEKDDRWVLQEALMRHRLRKNARDPVAHFNLGSVLQARGELTSAIDHFRLSLELRPGDPVTQNNLGAALQSLGRYEDAMSLFRSSLNERPDYVSARYNMGNTLLALGRLKEAVAEFERIVEVDPDDSAAHTKLGLAFANLSDFGRSESAFRSSLRLNPSDSASRTGLAMVLARVGRLLEAREELERLLDSDPNNPVAHANLAQILSRAGEFDEAARHLEKSLEADPRQPDTLNNLGILLARQGKVSEAADRFEQALKIDPLHEQARANLARARALLQSRP